MKNIWVVVCCVLCAVAQAQTPVNETYDNSSVERLGQMGKAYISEVKRIAGISYSDVTLNINIRKERSFANNTVAKDIYFSGSNAEGTCEGFIEASEADDAINALKYISDSLLTTTPENEIHFAKRFSNSFFVIYASYSPSPGKIFTKGEWDISVVLNEHESANNQGTVHIKRSDLGTLIQILQTCKEKLKVF